jgi:hypothetical protein
MGMRVKRWRIMMISIGIVIVMLGLLLLARNSYLILFTNSLEVSSFVNHEGDYSADILDNNNRVANIFVRFPTLVYNGLTEIPATVSIWHQESTKLKSLELTFSSQEFLSVALNVPGGFPWPNLEFHHTSDSKGVLFHVADLGFQGTGTVTLDFFIEMQSSQKTLSFNLYAHLTMQKDAPFTFSREVAESQVDVQTSRA